MNEAHERILDVLLEEELGRRSPPDLTELVLARIRGQRPARRRASAGRSVLRRAAIAAAAGLLLAVVVVRLWPGGAPDEVDDTLATSTTPLAVAVEPGSVETRERFSAGDVVLNAGPDDVTLELRAGGSIELRPGVALRIETDGARLLAGRIRLRAPPARFRVVTPSGAIDAEPAASLDVEIRESTMPTPPRLDERAWDRLGDGDPPLGPVVVAVRRGSATVAPARTVRAGEVGAMRPGSDAAVAPLPSAAERARLDAWIGRLFVSEASFAPDDPELLRKLKTSKEAPQELASFLRSRPEAWGYVAALLSRARPEASPTDVRRVVLEMLARDPELRAARDLERAIAEEPSAFDVGTLLRLAERGFAPAVPPLETLVAGMPSNHAGRRARVYAATYFGLRGDPRGRAFLDWAVETLTLEPFDIDFRLASAAALHVLGDVEPWRRAVRQLTAAVERRLVAGELEMARWLVLRAEYFHAAVARGATVSVAWMSRPVDAYVAANEGRLRTRDAVHRALGALVD